MLTKALNIFYFSLHEKLQSGSLTFYKNHLNSLQTLLRNQWATEWSKFLLGWREK